MERNRADRTERDAGILTESWRRDEKGKSEGEVGSLRDEVAGQELRESATSLKRQKTVHPFRKCFRISVHEWSFNKKRSGRDTKKKNWKKPPEEALSVNKGFFLAAPYFFLSS